MSFSAIAGLIVLCMFWVVPAAAHSPHDDVFDVAISSNYAEDETIFVIVRSALFVSRDGGKTWTRMLNGIDNKSILYSMDMAPDDATLYMTSLGNGLYRSTDAGRSWRRLTNGPENSVLDLVVVDPKDADHVFTAGMTEGLYRTVDGGESWTDVTGDLGKVTALAFHPGDGDHLFVTTNGGGLFESVDGGETWRQRYRSDAADPLVALWLSDTADAKSPTILVGTRSGAILRSDDGAKTFTPVWESAAAEPIVAFGDSLGTTGGDGRIYASLWYDGVYYSEDAGRSWHRCAQGLTENVQGPKVGRPSFGPFAVADGGSAGTRMFLAGFDGLFVSQAGACDWRQIETLSSSNIVAIGPSPNFADDNKIFVTTWLWGQYVSEDGGKKWKTQNDGNMDFVRDNGLTRLFDIVFSPNFDEDQTMFSGTWYRLLKSDDGGASWRKIKIGDEARLGGVHNGLVIAVSPDFEEDQTVYLGTHRGILLKSIDGGENFDILLDVGVTIGDISAVRGPGGEPTVFVADTHGVRRSSDGGETWRFTELVDPSLHFEIVAPPQVDEPEAGNFVNHLYVQRNKALHIKLAASPAYAEDLTVFAGTANGLFVTRDGGDSWDLVGTTGLGADAYIEAVAVSPTFDRDGLVLASVRGEGLFRSVDGGRTFAPIASELLDDQIVFGHFPGVVPKFPAIVFSPTYAVDGTVFAHFGNRLFESTDAGAEWREIHAFSPDRMAELYVDARYFYDLFKKKFYGFRQDVRGWIQAGAE